MPHDGSDSDCDAETPPADGARPTVTRRALLRSVGGATALSYTVGSIAHARGRRRADLDQDGLVAAETHTGPTERALAATFGDQFDGLDPSRRELLIDVRYVRGTSVAAETKAAIEGLFRREGIHAQWLDYPKRYDRERFEREYGSNARTVLWGGNSFYRTEIKREFRNVAVQLVVVPGRSHPAYEGLVYSPWTDALGGGQDGHVNGFSVGNRAVVAERDQVREEQRLILHEIAHLALCHADDPQNDGVMGTGERIDLTDREWERLRRNLDNVRDRTGYDVLFRSCLWEDCLPML
ncbi:hypothetical protein SAMN06269185_0881 [Natronoarchaeum philippinense]|uniref:Uncharacterized protein n=1 Tax=Natronoarchaeum philippinense TaxID=558529 RepID=A0A285N7X6_NATPI|nr:hypothetical protein [Natronoarchaeum philippinense]SNZ05520.1 hypothetical protein SAMN06269185_0881 [Natronoarchaeum philippinense]